MAYELKNAKNEIEMVFMQLVNENSADVPLEAIAGQTAVADLEGGRGTITLPLTGGYTHNGEASITFNWALVANAKETLFTKVEGVSFDKLESEVESEEIIAEATKLLKAAIVHPFDAESVTITYEEKNVKVDFSKSIIVHSDTPEDNVMTIPVTFKEVDPKDLTDQLSKTTLDAFTSEDLIAAE